LAYTSDIHADATPANAALLPHLAHRVRELNADAFIIAGDLAETAPAVRAALEAFAPLELRKFYLPGNHDLFVEDTPPPGATSRDKYETQLPAVAMAAGFEYLGLEAHAIGDVGVCGVTGWYDYAFRDPALAVVVDERHYETGVWRDVRAFDRGHVFWPRAGTNDGPAWAGDREIETWMRERLRRQAQALAGARAVIAAVHVLPFAELVVRGAYGPVAFHDAWLGSAALGVELRRIPALRAVVCGHLHRSADLQLGSVRVVARPVGTLRDAGIDLRAVARDRIGVLDLD
jgi:hypothetical protein